MRHRHVLQEEGGHQGYHTEHQHHPESVLEHTGEREPGGGGCREESLRLSRKSAVHDDTHKGRTQRLTKLHAVADHPGPYPKLSLWQGILSGYHLDREEGACAKADQYQTESNHEGTTLLSHAGDQEDPERHDGRAHDGRHLITLVYGNDPARQSSSKSKTERERGD